jgi:hypothetical protein
MPGDYKNQIYIGTVLLEKNRWAKTAPRQPSMAISDWCSRITDAGFDGIELWQNHGLLASDQERQKLKDSSSPVKILNTYAGCDTEAEEERTQTVEVGQFLGVEGMKFNFGKLPERHHQYCENVKKWRATLPEDFRFLCECHGGTTLEDPQVAADTFAQMNRKDYEIIIHGFGGSDADIERLFALHAERITHVHANLSSDQDMSNRVLQKRFDLLLNLGFCGSFTIEFTEGVGEESESPEILFRNAVRDLNALRHWMQ